MNIPNSFVANQGPQTSNLRQTLGNKQITSFRATNLRKNFDNKQITSFRATNLRKNLTINRSLVAEIQIVD